ncbi:uncharacterized protein LOC126560349 [Anopheles maculipalpis]|uniref:uncharacterized protein LOC126560349 n=1 Tax=Anopheles maculipalpis TaxID=1496333 RepID=UPI0021592DEE|nr:uncharacterized protein LOC126560349 [Anopheles maculipalpis]
MIAKRLPFLVLVSIVCFLGVSWCDRDSNQLAKEQLSKPSDLDAAFYVTTDFILRLNILIKHLALYSLDDALDARQTILHAGEMWNHTQKSLEDLVLHSRSAIDVLPDGNLTNTYLHAALDAVRTERRHFMTRVAFFYPPMATEIDVMAFIDRTYQDGGMVTTNPDIILLMHSSVHRLSKISEGLLSALGAVVSNSDNRQARANPTQASVDLFNEGFYRTIVDTQLNFQTQANRLLRRVRAQLATITLTSELGLYLTNYTGLITMFKTNVTTHLNLTSANVMTAMTLNRTTIDLQLSTGITNLLASVAASTSHAYLEVCLNRYVFPYYAQSLAVAKLLYCGEPELRMLEYLVTVAIPILERAAISDSSAVKISVICSTGSTDCMTNYYNSLADQFMGAQTRLTSYVEFINQELLGLEQRVYVCTNSTVLDVANYVTVIATQFATCLETGTV